MRLAGDSVTQFPPRCENRASDSYASHGNRGSHRNNRRHGGGWKPSVAFHRVPRRHRLVDDRLVLRPFSLPPPPSASSSHHPRRVRLSRRTTRPRGRWDTPDLSSTRFPLAIRRRPRRYASRPPRQLFEPLRLEVVASSRPPASRCCTRSSSRLSILKLFRGPSPPPPPPPPVPPRDDELSLRSKRRRGTLGRGPPLGCWCWPFLSMDRPIDRRRTSGCV